jgi:hypothetical protein
MQEDRCNHAKKPTCVRQAVAKFWEMLRGGYRGEAGGKSCNQGATVSKVSISSQSQRSQRPGGAGDGSYELAAPQAPTADAAGEAEASGLTVAGPERACPHCGFKVRGKTRGNRCPECGAILDASTAELLQFSAAAWIREISWGPVLVGLAALLHIAGLVSWPLAQAVQAGLDGKVPPGPANLMTGLGMHGLGSLLVLAGTWMLTAREPEEARRGMLMRQVCRWLSLAAFLLWASVLAVGMRHAAGEFLIFNAALIAVAAQAVALGYFCAGLAQRIPHDGLANQFRNMMPLVPAFVAFLLFCRFVDVTDYYKIFFLSLPVIFGLLGFMMWLAVSFFRLTWELRAAARASDAIREKHALRAMPRAVP